MTYTTALRLTNSLMMISCVLSIFGMISLKMGMLNEKEVNKEPTQSVKESGEYALIYENKATRSFILLSQSQEQASPENAEVKSGGLQTLLATARQ